MRRLGTALLVATATSLSASARLAAQNRGIDIESLRRDPIEAATTVTMQFAVGNSGGDSVRLMPHVDLPSGWSVLTGTAPVVLPARSHEVLIVSLAVPARTRAGVYPVRVAVTTAPPFAFDTDSALVVVPERRAIELELLDRPAYAVSPRAYEAVFLLRNRGNAMATVRLAARSSRGAAGVLGEALTRLEADESRVVRVHVRPPSRIQKADDQVIELCAVSTIDSSHKAIASARVTVVPAPAGEVEDFARVPAQLRLRSAGASGVSPFEFFGSGMLRDGGVEHIDLLVRGRGRNASPFAERDEYRAELRGASWRLRIGDHFYALSPLSSPGRPGVGGGAEVTRGMVFLGAHGQAFRREPAGDREVGGFVGAQFWDGTRLALNVVERVSGAGSVGIASAQGAFQHGGSRADVEVARSEGASAPAFATSARVSGAVRHVAFDAGLLRSDATFAGSEPGARHAYASASGRASRVVLLSMSASSHTGRLGQRFDFGTLAATFADALTAELGAAGREIESANRTLRASQQSLRLHGRRTWGLFTLTLGVEGGLASTPDTSSRGFSDLHGAIRLAGRRASASAFVARHGGTSVTKGNEATLSAGGDVSARLFSAIDASMTAFTIRRGAPGVPPHGNVEGRVSQSLPNGSRLGFRFRLIAGDRSGNEQSAAFLEYTVPLRVPVSRLKTPGRVQGRIVDAVSGRGVPNALVRVGPEVAVTDSKGEVSFARVPAGEHRVSLAQETSLTDAVFIGDPLVRVDSTGTRPLTFRLQVARAARITVFVIRFASVRTSLNGGPDSLAAAGPQADVVVRLEGQRDTLYRSTDVDGRASFVDVPPGRWTVAVHSDAPALHRFEPDRHDVTLAPGAMQSLEIRQVPRPRDIRIIGDGEELRPVPAEPRSGRHRSH